MKKKHLLFSSLLSIIILCSFSVHNTLIDGVSWTTFDKLSSKKMTVIFISAFSSPPKTVNSSSNNGSVPGAWDRWTRRMEATTFSDKKIVKHGKKAFNFVKLDVYEQKTIFYKGKAYSFDTADGEYGRHQLVKYFVGENRKTPTTVILDKNKDILRVIRKYIDNDDLDAILKYYNDGTYKSQPWELFKEGLKLVDY